MHFFIQGNAFENIIWKKAVILSQPQCVISSPPSAAYMHQWIGSTLVLVMACHLFGAKPLCKPMLQYDIVNWTLRNKLQWIFFIKIQKSLFIEMHLKISSAKMSAILSRGRWVNWPSCQWRQMWLPDMQARWQVGFSCTTNPWTVSLTSY